MSDHLNIADFLSPIKTNEISHNEGYKDGQLGYLISRFENEFPDLDEAQVVILGCGEQRGSGLIHGHSQAPDIVRRHLYSLYSWHPDIRVADIGNIRAGSLYTDSYAALKTVVKELI